MNSLHVKKGDTVMILSGKDRSTSKKMKKGKVLAVYPKENKVLVEGINLVTKHVRPRKAQQQGGLVHQESPVHISNVILVCNNCGKPTKTKKSFLNDGSKVRICKKCDQMINTIKEVDK